MDHAFLTIIVVQIVGEALPISSSGHLSLATALFAKKLNVLPEHFDHFLHGPTILLVLCFFWRAWWGPVRHGVKSFWRLVRGGGWYALPYSNRCLLALLMRVGVMVVVADGVTAVLYGVIKVWGVSCLSAVPRDVASLLLGMSGDAFSPELLSKGTKGVGWVILGPLGNPGSILFFLPLLFGFCVTGLVLLSLMKIRNGSRVPLRQAQWPQDDKNHSMPTSFSKKIILTPTLCHPGARTSCVSPGSIKISFLKTSLLLGTIQGLALLPGISRFATTAVAAQWLGMSPRRSVQFSFLMFFPLMCAAFIFNGLPPMLKHSELFTGSVCATIAGATALSFAAFALSYRLVVTRRLWWFGVYMLLPVSVAVWLLVW